MEFSLKRLTALCKQDFRTYIVTTVGITSLVLFVIATFNILIARLVNPISHNSFDLFSTWMSTFFIVSTIVGAVTWAEINKRPSRIEYLTLPATALEKVVSKFLNTAVAFPLAMFALYYCIYGYASIFADDFFTIETYAHIPAKYYLTIAAFLAAIFAYGSIKFNTAAYPKIILWSMATFAIFVLINFLFALVIFPELRMAIIGNADQIEHTQVNANPEDFWGIKLATSIYFLAPVVYWVLSYFELKEKEA